MTEVKAKGKVELELVIRDKDGKIKDQEIVEDKHGNYHN
jgi:hypothetical protein